MLSLLTAKKLMASRSEPPAAIEGLQILVSGLAIKLSGVPRRHPTVGLVYPLDVTRRGSGIIEREYSPKEARVRPHSLLNEGDSISGTHLWGFSSSPLKRDDINVGQAGRSGRHSGQDIRCRGTCFLEIIHGWQGSPLPRHPRQELLSGSHA